ncbi:hypothetical protein ABZ470_39520 [Streptosporangium sp. NPDC020072]|uniref:hypothetical protein n=1 Tax=Streptosporangium sp. NPDC020072 TaxID=3154788 RepID=UPI00343349AD
MDRRQRRRRGGLLGAGPGSRGPGEDGSQGGPLDELTGLRDWYDPDDGLSVDGAPITWAALLERWALVEADLHSEYGIDLQAPGLMAARTWRWLRTRIFGLLAADTRICRALTPDDDASRR